MFDSSLTDRYYYVNQYNVFKTNMAGDIKKHATPYHKHNALSPKLLCYFFYFYMNKYDMPEYNINNTMLTDVGPRHKIY